MFIIPSLNTGGSERVILHLLKYLDRRKFEITLLILKKEGALLPLVPDDINVISFNYHRTAHAVPAIFKMTWKLRPDILFSTLGHLNLIIAALKPFLPSDISFVARESSIISLRNKDERYPNLFNFLFKTIYKRFDRIICQSNYMKDDLLQNFSIPERLITVINNPVDFKMLPSEFTSGRSPDGLYRLISIGQLRREKGYERVIEALSRCNVNFEYKIIGGGNKEPLQTLTNRLNLTDKVHLMGSIASPYEDLSKSDCLILGSYYEGFPNVVLEANACGIPVIAFAAPGGHNEIIQSGINGWFITSHTELDHLLKSQAFRSVDRTAIINLTRQRYGMEKIIKQYEMTLTNTTKD